MWWMSASFSIGAINSLTISFFDQGIGIPASLPRTLGENIKSLFNILNDDGRMIMAATRLGRSQTKSSHRGKGLSQVKDFISSMERQNGYLRIISGSGEYLFNKRDDIETETTTNRKQKLQGTLIEWQVDLIQEGKT